jgi:hypothetical protein
MPCLSAVGYTPKSNQPASETAKDYGLGERENADGWGWCWGECEASL